MKSTIEELEGLIALANERLTNHKIELKYREVIMSVHKDEEREFHIIVLVNRRTVVYKSFSVLGKIDEVVEMAAAQVINELFFSGIINAYNVTKQIDENRKYYSDGEGY